MTGSNERMQTTSTVQISQTEEPIKGLSTNLANNILNGMGRPIPGKPNFYFILIMLSHVFVAAQSLIVIIAQWNDFAVRSKAIENLNLEFLSFLIIGELASSPEKIELLMKITDGSIFKCNIPLSEKQSEIRKETILEENGMKKRFQVIITYYCIVAHIIPFLYSVAIMTLTEASCCEKAHYSYVYWLPIPLDNTVLYCFILIIQMICAISMCTSYVCWFVLFISCLLHIGEEIEILCIFIDEIDNRLQMTSNSEHSQFILNDNEESDRKTIKSLDTEEEIKLKLYMKELIQHHLGILQAVKDVNRTSSRVLFVYNQFCCIELCLNLYLAVEVTDMKRYNYLSTLIALMILVGMIGNVGQKLSNKGEKLYKIINECSWMNKPQWFKKSLKMMIIHSAKPLQIKPGGLYVLNLENTMKIGKAAYSLFNLLRSIK